MQFDILYRNNEPAFIVLQNISSEPASAVLDGNWTGLFSSKTGGTINLDPDETDLFVIESGIV